MKNFYSVLLVGAMLAIPGCGGGGGGSSSSSNIGSQAPRPSKAYRDPLMAQDVNTFYSDSGTYSPIVNNRFGQLTFRLADGEPTDVVSVDKYTGELTLLNPGDVRIYVEDNSSVYQTSSDIFTVHLEKSPNVNLSASLLTISTHEAQPKYLDIRGTQGTLSYEVAPDSTHLIDIDRNSGAITPLDTYGWATVYITDNGNRRYEPKTIRASVKVESVSLGELKYGKITQSYSEGLTLMPQQVSGGNKGTFRYQLDYHYADSDVLTVNPYNGQMIVNKQGTVVIKVINELDDSYSVDKREAYFYVEITQGLRSALSVSDASFPYSPDHVITPSVNNAKGDVSYHVESGDDVIAIDYNTRKPKIVGVGTATLVATDNRNENYEPSSDRFEYTVTEADHPGLGNKHITHVFTEDLVDRQLTPVLEGQKGRLTFVGPSNVVSAQPGKLSIEHAGTTKLTVTDDGGPNYKSSTAELTVTIEKAPHPALNMDNITRKYQDNLCIELSDANITGNKGALSVTLRGEPADSPVTFDVSKSCFNVHKQGSAIFDVVSQESADYEASAPQPLTIVINPADSTISVDNGIEAVYAPGNPTINPPTVTGYKGTLSYRLAPSTKYRDVVQVNSQTGKMTVLNAGSTTVEVTDSGADGFKSATTTFSVTINPAENPVEVSYPAVAYKSGESIFPTVRNAATGLKYYLYNSSLTVVELANTSTGEMKVKSAGDYQVSVNAEKSRNYLARHITGIIGRVEKAPHPGIVTEKESFYFEPMKKITLDLPNAIGSRSFSVESNNGRDNHDFSSIDSNSGEVTLLDYDPRASDALMDVQITEAESKNYLALGATVEAEKQFYIKPPKQGVADKDVALAPIWTLDESNLNLNTNFKALEGTSVRFAGLISVLQPTTEQLNRLGEGANLLALVQPVGSTNVADRRSVQIYAKRYVGCESEVNVLNLVNVKSVKMDSSTYCLFGNTNRFMTYTLVDDSNLTPGEWELVTPFVAYEYSDRLFSSSDSGGAYVNGGGTLIGGAEPTHVVEWHRLTLRFTKD
ncbi:hypothetical protein [Photobacterium sp. J15]|uniref:hypothetical protein n=1 Tax=Photobacterium sp. J15 TaxID=265901 RepID=UPI0007E33815|nr:hypothetical protein [Photobacterium sp. J15]